MRTIRRIVPSHLAEVQGTPISRALPSDDVNQISPFLLIDHIGPMTLVPGRPFTVEDHPHRGFEPVTFVFAGCLEHRDSTGAHGLLGPGDVQWMTSGAGVVHRESVPGAYADTGGLFHAVQLWVNLPAAHKSAAPRYQDIGAADIPVREAGGVRLRLVAGELDGLSGPAATFTPMLIAHGTAAAGGAVEIAVPECYNAAVYVTHGSLRSSGEAFAARKLAWFDGNGASIHLFAPEEAAFLVLAGEPIDEPVAAAGPFVMNTPEELAQAIADYDAGRMGKLA